MLFTVPYDATSQPAELLWQCGRYLRGGPGRGGGIQAAASLKIVHEQRLTVLCGGVVPLGIREEDMTDRLTETFAPIATPRSARASLGSAAVILMSCWMKRALRGDAVDNMHTKKDVSTLEECLRWSNLDAAEVKTQGDGAEREGVGEEGSD
jgi:hypothetical protein